MKKLLYSAVALATLLFAACQQENLEPETTGGNTVTYTISVPGALATKAIGTNVNAVTELIYEVYRTEAQTANDYDADEQLLYKRKATITAGTAYLTLELVNKQNFRVLFWAQVPETGIYNTTNLKSVTIGQALTTNMESYAAFAGSDFIKAGDILTGRIVKLHRPVAQLNIATDAESLVIGNGDGAITTTTVEIDNCYVTVKGLSTSYNVAEDAAGDIVESSFIYNRYDENNPPVLSETTLTVKNEPYTYVAMNYLGFAPALGTNVEVTYEIDTNVGTIDNKIGNVPVKPNYRTNIVGNLITETSDYTIILDNAWPDDVRENMEVLVEGLVKNINGDYEITSAKGLAYAINNLFANGGDFYLTEEIYDLSGFAVTPPTVSGVTLNIYGETPVVTRAATTLAGITIIGLDSFIDEIKSDASVVITGVTIQNDKSTTVNLVNKVEDGAEVLVSDCFVIDNTGAASDEMSALIGDGNENVEGDWVIDEEGNGKINFAKGLKLFAETVNSGNTFAGKTVTLNCDVDLNNEQWASIGTSENPFSGIFDGQNHTISNLVVNGGSKSNQGLFGMTQNGEIKNLIVNNAQVSGRLNVGVVAGTPYTSKFTNITVKGHVEVNGMAYVGGVGGKNAYADWNNVSVEVDETSYVNANSVENGTAYRTYVGGVVGFNGEGGHSFTNIASNINVKGSTCDVGGLFGIAHYGNKFVNCTCSGDVEIYNASEADEVEEMGGIAGVWHNENGTSVSFTDCSFTGTLKSNITEGVNLSDNTIVGKAYNTIGTGKLFVNGYELIVPGLMYSETEKIYTISTAEALKKISELSANNTFEGNTLVLTADIDLGGAEWTPIGRTSKHFNGSFDGQGHTISNFKITQNPNGETRAALFGTVSLTTVFKDFNIDNIQVLYPENYDGDFYGAAVIGTFYGNVTLQNINVTNSTIQGNNKVAGLIAHDGSSSNVIVENCNVTGCTIETKNEADGGNVGGLVGIFQNTKATVKNCSVIGCTINAINSSDSGKRANGLLVGGTIASKTNPDAFYLTIQGCNVSNNTFNETGRNSYVSPYGDGTLVGGAREGEYSIGKVEIDGVVYPQN